MSEQLDLFTTLKTQDKPSGDLPRKLEVLITVKAAPQPSNTYGETVCVAGVSRDPDLPGWIRLYPINFRFLDQDVKFKKYDIVTVTAVPARNDNRYESWRPRMNTLQVVRRLPPGKGWEKRRRWLVPHRTGSMCRLLRDVREDPAAASLGLVRARQVKDLEVRRHEGWTKDEQAKIEAYVNQLDLLSDTDRTPLQAPRLRAWYRWTCHDPECKGHRQGLLDWEFVAFQRRLSHLDDESLISALRQKFLHEVCGPDRDVSFYVGNQAKRRHVFSVLGAFWPPQAVKNTPR